MAYAEQGNNLNVVAHCVVGDVEGNEDDAKYMEFLVELAREHLGDNVILFTTDGDGDVYLTHGTLEVTDALDLRSS